MLFHGTTTCFAVDEGLVLWNRASAIRINREGTRIHAEVHTSSVDKPTHFSMVTVMMALLLGLRKHGCFHLHAACARLSDGQVWVMPGESGAGKSTLSLALFAAGAEWLSDDAVLLRRVEPGVEVLGWARMMRMTAKTAEAFPQLSSLLEPCPPGSARDWEVDPRLAFPGRGRASVVSPVTLAFPRISSTHHSEVVVLDPADAFGRILHACAWVAVDNIERREEQLELLRELTAGSRSLEVAMGQRILTDPAGAISEIVEAAEARQPS